MLLFLPLALLAQETKHVVKRGDTVKSIAASYKISEAELLEANPGVSSKFLLVGQTLNIPAPKKSADVKAEVKKEKKAPVVKTPPAKKMDLPALKKEPVPETQKAKPVDDAIKRLPQDRIPEGVDDDMFVLYYNDGTVYNSQGREVCEPRGSIRSLKINPAKFSFAVLSGKVQKRSVAIYAINKYNEVLHKFKNVEKASAICFSQDARRFMIACDNVLDVYETSGYTQVARYNLDASPFYLCTSYNGYYLSGIVESRKVIIWNMETMAVRKELDMDANVSKIAFSDDNYYFGVLTVDGKLYLYDARSFQLLDCYDRFGEGYDFSFHPDGKYVAVVSAHDKITVVNALDAYERYNFDDSDGGISKVRFFVSSINGVANMTYNTTSSLSYRPVNNLSPNYARLLEEEMRLKMDEWLQRMPGESLEEYRTRVNEETRAEHARLLEEEIATRLAGDMLHMEEIGLGNYNNEHGLLALNFSTMPTIYLPVPASEVSSFRDTGYLDFRNVKYGLTKSDRFEMIYAEVYNGLTGKTYIFDNRDRNTLSYLYSEDQFVPLEYVEQANMEEIMLTEIKEKVVELAKQDKIITDDTHISVNAHVVKDYDADGKRIWNYEVGFDYDVPTAFSARDDFAPGKYLVEDSPAAMSMLTIVKEALSGSIAQYIKDGKKLRIRITGSADSAPIRSAISYNGRYGEFVNEPIYQDGSLTSITVTKSQGIVSNEQLAFMRAMGVQRYLESNISDLQKMRTEYSENVEVANKRGGAYRRISVVFTFVDAF